MRKFFRRGSFAGLKVGVMANLGGGEAVGGIWAGHLLDEIDEDWVELGMGGDLSGWGGLE